MIALATRIIPLASQSLDASIDVISAFAKPRQNAIQCGITVRIGVAAPPVPQRSSGLLGPGNNSPAGKRRRNTYRRTYCCVTADHANGGIVDAPATIPIVAGIISANSSGDRAGGQSDGGTSGRQSGRTLGEGPASIRIELGDRVVQHHRVAIERILLGWASPKLLVAGDEPPDRRIVVARAEIIQSGRLIQFVPLEFRPIGSRVGRCRLHRRAIGLVEDARQQRTARAVGNKTRALGQRIAMEIDSLRRRTIVRSRADQTTWPEQVEGLRRGAGGPARCSHHQGTDVIRGRGDGFAVRGVRHLLQARAAVVVDVTLDQQLVLAGFDQTPTCIVDICPFFARRCLLEHHVAAAVVFRTEAVAAGQHLVDLGRPDQLVLIGGRRATAGLGQVAVGVVLVAEAAVLRAGCTGEPIEGVAVGLRQVGRAHARSGREAAAQAVAGIGGAGAVDDLRDLTEMRPDISVGHQALHRRALAPYGVVLHLAKRGEAEFFNHAAAIGDGLRLAAQRIVGVGDERCAAPGERNGRRPSGRRVTIVQRRLRRVGIDDLQRRSQRGGRAGDGRRLGVGRQGADIGAPVAVVAESVGRGGLAAALLCRRYTAAAPPEITVVDARRGRRRDHVISIGNDFGEFAECTGDRLGLGAPQAVVGELRRTAGCVGHRQKLAECIVVRGRSAVGAVSHRPGVPQRIALECQRGPERIQRRVRPAEIVIAVTGDRRAALIGQRRCLAAAVEEQELGARDVWSVGVGRSGARRGVGRRIIPADRRGGGDVIGAAGLGRGLRTGVPARIGHRDALLAAILVVGGHDP
ncbi:hypothetical protein MCHI_003293 [Candidatus Magnetoovum chiemensis]|nr:hypothetical protein MCHI_003293 [Candidatus Magnetoovum chiemensis]